MIKCNELMDFMVRDDRKTTKHYLEEELYNNGNLKIERLERLKQLMEMCEMCIGVKKQYE